MIGLPQNMIRQQGKNNGTDLARLDALSPGRLEIPEFESFLQGGVTAQRLILPLTGSSEKFGIILRKAIGGID